MCDVARVQFLDEQGRKHVRNYDKEQVIISYKEVLHPLTEIPSLIIVLSNDPWTVFLLHLKQHRAAMGFFHLFSTRFLSALLDIPRRLINKTRKLCVP